MKKIFCGLLMVIIIFTAAGTAFAVGGTVPPSPTGSAPQEGTVLTIDNQNIYAGMDKPYSSGYLPTVADGTATLMLPLTSAQALSNNSFNVVVDLGDPSASPFVFGNYDKTITLAEHSVNNGAGTTKAYLVDLNLALAGGRTNGRYPVTITAQGQTSGGTQFSQLFTLYVTITDGIDPNATPKPEPTPEPPKEEQLAPQPKAMIASYTVNPSPVLAGQEFDVSVTLQNTNDSQPMRNVKVTVSGETADVVCMDETNSFYFKKIGTKDTVTLNAKMLVQQTAEPKPQKILIHIEYEGDKQAAFTSDESIVIRVKQPIRIEFDEPEIPKQVNAGDTMSVPLNVMNMGKGTVYNVRAELSAPGLVPEGTVFLGNMESGAAKKGDLYTFVGTLDSDAGNSDNKYGPTSGKITISYEDEFGEAATQEIAFTTNINPPVINAPAEKEEEKPQTQSQWWISVIILGAVIGAVFGVRYYIKRKKEKAGEDEDN
ncbi:MAG: hypothetical protein RR632_06600 [Christensenella sp.]